MGEKKGNNYFIYYIIGGLLIIIVSLLIFTGNNFMKNDKKNITITLLGDETIELDVNSSFIEPGYKAYDDKNNDLTSKVIIDSNLDPSKEGTYTITYKFGDVVRVRTIKIVNKNSDDIRFYLLGNENYQIKLNGNFNDPGFVCKNNKTGENLKSKVIVNGNINTSKVGTYKITYTLNYNGKKVILTRTISVTGNNYTLTADKTSLTSSDVTITFKSHIDNFSHVILPDGIRSNQKTSTYVAKSNGVYIFKMYDNDGNITTAQISISNIDKEAPVITSCSGKAEGNKTTLNITTNDSDIDKYSFNGNWYKWSGKNITLDGKHQSVTLSFSDKVGNTSNVSCNIEYINDPIPTPSVVSMSNYEFPKVSNVTTKKVLKVLVIEMDPVLSKGTIEGRSCAGITASVCLGQNKSQVINELVNDIESSSHGIIDVQIVKTEKLNEFSTHKNKATLLNGTKDYKLDEDTWLDIMKNGWYGFWDDERVKEFGDYSLDYEYLLNKFNLVQRRNNNEFNEVWLVNVDPTRSFESLLVGKNPYWMNGDATKKPCDNFKMINVSTSRPDTNFECYGHASEFIMNNVFKNSVYDYYNANYVNINSTNYSNLSLWEKFTLTDHTNISKNTGLAGAGNVHFSPNSTKDYDWANYTTTAKSKWKEWLNYPYLTNNPSNDIFSPSVYMHANISGTNSEARLHHRWWFGLMPHVTGYTSDGYSNNWWDYLYLGDFVTSITSSQGNYTYNVGDNVDNIKFVLKYNSLSQETITIKKYGENTIFSNKDIFNVDSDGKIIAAKKGSSTMKYYRDGVYKTINITIN